MRRRIAGERRPEAARDDPCRSPRDSLTSKGHPARAILQGPSCRGHLRGRFARNILPELHIPEGPSNGGAERALSTPPASSGSGRESVRPGRSRQHPSAGAPASGRPATASVQGRCPHRQRPDPAPPAQAVRLLPAGEPARLDQPISNERSTIADGSHTLPLG